MSAVKRSNRQAAKERILVAYTRSDRPILIGRAAILVGWSLDETESLLEEMVTDDKNLRRATADEMRRWDIQIGYIVKASGVGSGHGVTPA